MPLEILRPAVRKYNVQETLPILLTVLSVSYRRAFAHKLIPKFRRMSSFIFLNPKKKFVHIQIYVWFYQLRNLLPSPKDEVIECNHSNWCDQIRRPVYC